MHASPELLASIERLYVVFSTYPLPKYTDPCLCCHTTEDEARVHHRPLRQLEPDDLQQFAYDAILTWGGERVLKHFLPRPFELFITIPNPSLHLADPEILFSKFRHGKWYEWPESEQDAVRNFFHCLWNDVLNYESRYDGDVWETESCLCSIAQSEDDLTPYFDQWIKNDSLEACLTLSGLLLQSAVALSKNHGRDAF